MDLTELEAILDSRLQSQDADSYTVQLSGQGTARVGQKFGEEAVETLIEGIQGRKQQLISESADMLYHWLLLLRMNDVGIEDVYQELAKRYRERAKTQNGV